MIGDRLAKITDGVPAYPLFVLFGLNAVDELDRVTFSLLLPDIRDDFGLSLTGVLGLVTAITPVTVVVGMLIAFYADRGPRVRMAAVGALVWAVFSTATGFAVNVVQLALARVGSGLAKATSDPTHNSMLADLYPARTRASVYAVHRGANNFGQLVGPLAAGFLAVYVSWRVPFLLFSAPTVVLVFLLTRIREPVRGIQDRLDAGATHEEAMLEQTPPSFPEAWRLLYAIPSLKRIYLALPFVGVSMIGFASLLNLFYADVYRLGPAERGVVAAGAELAALVGLFVGAPLAQRLLNRDPSLVLRFLAVTAVLIGLSIAVIALSPNVAVAIAGNFVMSGVNALLIPGTYAVFSIVIPARVRSMGFVSGSLWTLPGLVMLPVIGSIGDTNGLRAGLLVLIPLFMVGSVIFASAGSFLNDDVDLARAASMAEHEARRALADGEPKLLMVRDLHVAYDKVQVLFGVDFDLRPGEIVALLGTNGAGKSTLLSGISGLVDPGRGSVYFDGLDVTHLDARSTAKLGLIQMPGGRSVFPTMSVGDHFKLAAWLAPRETDDLTAATDEVLEIFPQLRSRWEEMAGNLSGGEQQMLGLSMALVAKPKLLMIDELSLGLAPGVVERLIEVVRRIHDQGTAIILVEQSVNVALTIAERAYFMEKGEVRFSGPTAELLERDDILRAVFLKDADRRPSSSVRTRPAIGPESDADAPDRAGPPVLQASGLVKRFGGMTAVNGAELAVHRNEILGIIGPNGAGKTTIFDMISGFLPADAGQIVFEGVDITAWMPDARGRAGLGRSFQDARLVQSCTVAENIALALERHLRTRDHLGCLLGLPHIRLQEEDIAWTVQDLIELMGLGAYRGKFASELSTGSRRIVDLAMCMAHAPRLLLLDEPSSGIAQREAEGLVPLLRRIQREARCSILLIEHDIQLITEVSHRMLALEVGAVIAEGPPADVIANPRVVSSYLGTSEAAINRSTVRRRRKLAAG